MKTDKAKAIQSIRSRGLSHINRLVPAARHLEILQPAFIAWNAGDIYVCKKTGDYRHRYGANSKHLCSWSAAAREVFATPGAFALAALVFASEQPAPAEAPQEEPKPKLRVLPSPTTGKHTSRADVLRMAIAGRGA